MYLTLPATTLGLWDHQSEDVTWAHIGRRGTVGGLSHCLFFSVIESPNSLQDWVIAFQDWPPGLTFYPYDHPSYPSLNGCWRPQPDCYLNPKLKIKCFRGDKTHLFCKMVNVMRNMIHLIAQTLIDHWSTWLSGELSVARMILRWYMAGVVSWINYLT